MAPCLQNSLDLVIQGNSVGDLFNGLLTELPIILDRFLPVPQVIT